MSIKPIQKPKILYKFFNMKLEKHEIKENCFPQIELENVFGVLFRCRCDKHDVYGYATRQEAKAEEVSVVKQEIYDRTDWLKKNS